MGKANNTPEERDNRVEIIASHFKEILETLGEHDREGLQSTPERVARMYMDEIYCSGDPLEEELSSIFVEKAKAREMVVVRDMPFVGWCVHGRTLLSTPERKPSPYAMLMHPGDRLYTVVNGKLETTVIQSVSKIPCRSDLAIRVGGRVLECSLDHPLFTQRGWVPARELGDYDKVYVVAPHTFRRTPLGDIVEGYSLGYVLGALASDGSVRNGVHDRGTRLGVTSEAFRNKYALHFQQAFPNQELHLKGPYECTAGFVDKVMMYEAWNCCNELANKVLQLLGVEHKDSNSFGVPKVCLRKAETMTGFVDGYVDGDGATYGKYNSRTIYSSNSDFLRELKELGIVGEPWPSTGVGMYACHVLAHPQFEPQMLGDDEVGVVGEEDYLGAFARVDDVESLSAVTRDKVLYNFECAPYPSYVANRMLSHNCEHHTLPYFGVAHVGYLPHGGIVGLSKIARLVVAAGRGLTIQERVTDRIADALDEKLEPNGVIVVLECVHTCMVARGVKAYTSKTITSALRGMYRDSEAARAEFYSILAGCK